MTLATREEHLEWCKKRALEYVEIGSLDQALASMGMDLSKHPETEDHPGMRLGFGLLIIGDLGTPQKMRDFINGFN